MNCQIKPFQHFLNQIHSIGIELLQSPLQSKRQNLKQLDTMGWDQFWRNIIFLFFMTLRLKKKSKNQVILSVFEKPISRCNIQILEVESFPTSPIIFSQNQFNRNTKFFLFLCSFCSNLSYMKKLQEQIKKAFCYQKLFWPFKVWIISLQPRILKVFREF